MGNIISYIRNMPPPQINMVRKFLKNKAGKSDPEVMDSKLFERILSCNEEELSDVALSKFLYGNKSAVSYRKLKSRLHEKVLEAFCCDSYLNDTSIFRSEGRLELKIRKKMFQCYVLTRTPNKERRSLLEMELEHIITLSKNAELFDELYAALLLKRKCLGPILAKEKLNRLDEQITFYQLHCQGISEASEYHTSNIRRSPDGTDEANLIKCM